MKDPRLILPALLLVLCTASAQTYVVDVTNGPGTNFTSIATAVAAVPDGATLLVRPGTYDAFEIVAKSLTVIGGNGVLVESQAAQSIRIADLAAHQSVALRRMSWTRMLYPGRLDCEDCAGTVLLDACIVDSTVAYFAGALSVQSCDRVFVRQCRIRPGNISYPTVTAVQSNVALVDCRLGNPIHVVDQTGGRVHVTDCLLTHNGFGANGMIEMDGGELVIAGDTTINATTFPSVNPFPAVHGSGTVTVDPSTTLVSISSTPYTAGITLVNRVVPRLDAATQTRGGTATSTLTVPGGSTGFLSVGFAATPYFVSATPDPIWLEPGAALQVTGSAPSVTGSYAVPNAVWVIGVQVAWQGAVLDASGAIALSNPNAYVHF
ncbi:MAG: hypothetical protein NXI31_20715 [bacterium]|nr:hypothetical protein [bacterium]